MPSGTNLIQDAYAEIGIFSENTDVSAFDIAFAKRKLESMMQEWIDMDMDFGFTATEFATDETSIPLAIYTAVTTNLGVRLAPFKGKVANQTLFTQAAISFARIRDQYQLKESENEIVSGTMPLGAGSVRGIKPPVFANAGFVLSDQAQVSKTCLSTSVELPTLATLLLDEGEDFLLLDEGEDKLLII
jgi:hypothetical protein